jgi:hypothetical protein
MTGSENHEPTTQATSVTVSFVRLPLDTTRTHFALTFNFQLRTSNLSLVHP